MGIPPQPTPKSWEPYRHGPGEWTHVEMFPSGMTRISYGLWWDGGLLTDMVLVQQVDVGDGDEPEWQEIVRVDCCHGEVHVHLLYLADPASVYRVIRPIDTPEDLRAGADEAEQLVYDEWEEHLRRWESGRR